MNEILEKRLQNPEPKYRGKPFWSWNGDLDEAELHRQIDIMKEMGFGGFFMHSRTGLITEYLGEKWFSLIRSCAKYGKEQNMEAWLYDEDRWPSGTCGGLVTKNRDFRLRFISEYDDDEQALKLKNVVGILRRYAVLFENGKIKDVLEINAKNETPDGYDYKVYAEELMDESAFYNGTTYLDTMNPKATEAFLQSTHDKYKEKCGDMFGKEILGIFTDEPHRGAAFSGFGISNKNKDNMTPYTGELFNAYQNKYGEKLCIPEIYYFRCGETENTTAAKYVDVLDDLFTENFAEKYKEKCKELGLKFTGHILHEDTLDFQTAVSGSMMRFYWYMDYPGMDNLSAHNSCYWVAIHCASVARQFNKPFVLSEMYGCTGWDMSLNEYKRIGDWQALFGVNLRCPHLSWYSMKGEAKRDYPASILHQNAWYRDWKELETYFGRINIVLSEGERQSEILVIHPVDNMWRKVHKGWQKNFQATDKSAISLNEKFQRQCLDLIDAQLEFDYGDEDLLNKYGCAGRDEKGAYLKIGLKKYRSVLLPEWLSVRETTQELLDKFTNVGGKITDKIEDLPKGEVLLAPQGIASAVRRLSGDTFLFLMNLSENEKTSGAVELNKNLSTFCAEEWNMVDFISMGEADLSHLSFEAGEMKIFLLREDDAKNPIIKSESVDVVNIDERLPYNLMEPNVLVLDRVNCFRENNDKFATVETDVLLLDRRLRQEYGLVPRGGEMIQPWYAKKYNEDKEKTFEKIRLEYKFYSKIDINVDIAAEYDCLFVNGKRAVMTDKYWVDKCFKLFSAKIRKGENIISVEVDFCRSTNLEAVYVLGQFGVELPSAICALPERISTLHIERQGMPFYGGPISFRTGITDGNVLVRLNELHGADVHISDGKNDKIIAFPPYKKVINLNGELVIILECTRRNTFGPHHLVPYPQYAYGPEAWISEGENRTDSYVLTEQGISFVLHRIK